MNNWKFFAGSCILAAGLLVKAGAPLVPLGLGIAAAAFFNWKRQRALVPGKKDGRAV